MSPNSRSSTPSPRGLASILLRLPASDSRVIPCIFDVFIDSIDQVLEYDSNISSLALALPAAHE